MDRDLLEMVNIFAVKHSQNLTTDMLRDLVQISNKIKGTVEPMTEDEIIEECLNGRR